VDAQGNAYVTGRTHSLNFPTTPGAFQTALQGSSDVFVTKVDATGSSLVYSTYLGGSGSGFEHGRGIAVDASGTAYVTGLTESPTFPTTPGAFRTSSSGSGEAFVTKMSTDGSGLVYSTYLGGGGYDEAFRIALDGAGNAYVTGETQSVNFPITPGAVQTVLRSAPDVFVTKVNSGGSALVYSTYLGGSNLDFGFGVAVDSGGNAYVTGLSYSNDFPATAGAFQRENHGSADAFAAEIDSSGSVLVFATYLGGRNYEEGHGIAVDKNGNSYLTGITYSANFPVRGGPDLKYNDSGDAFAAKIVK
jgi:hypothetical protein